jgi:hypothetical protein
MILCRYNPTLSEVLADPMTRAMMAADGVDAQALTRELRAMAAALNPSGRERVAIAKAGSFERPRSLDN